MAAAEEEARQKALKALREKQDMLIAIKERKAEGQLLKYYSNEKYKVACWERDPEGYLPIHWAGEAQCKQNVFEVLLDAYASGVKEETNRTKEKPGGDLVLHLLCKGIITADTDKAFRIKVEDKKGAIEVLVNAYPDACKLRIKGKLALHNAARSNTPALGIAILVDANPDAVRAPEARSVWLQRIGACCTRTSEAWLHTHMSDTRGRCSLLSLARHLSARRYRLSLARSAP